MKPASINIEIQKGDSRAFTYLLKDVNEDALDVENLLSDVLVSVKSAKRSSSNEVIRRSISEESISTPETGRISYSLSPSDLKRVPEGLYFWELKLVYLDGTVQTWAEGEFKIV